MALFSSTKHRCLGDYRPLNLRKRHFCGNTQPSRRQKQPDSFISLQNQGDSNDSNGCTVDDSLHPLVDVSSPSFLARSFFEDDGRPSLAPLASLRGRTGHGGTDPPGGSEHEFASTTE